MRILLTGASSFTGYWFADALSAAGHEVTCAYTRAASEYEGVRQQRVLRLSGKSAQQFGVRFGDASFLELLRTGAAFDLVCHHGAEAKNHKAAEFDWATAVRENTFGVEEVARIGRARGLKALVITGTYFEADEGVGSEPLGAFSPYALSKGLTWQVVRYHCEQHGVTPAKFVLPNPIGPLDQPRFVEHLFRAWRRREPAPITTPDYVRDNAPVQLLARAYADFVTRLGRGAGAPTRLNPSGWVETVGEFAERAARHVRAISGAACELRCAAQREFPEPRVRANRDSVVGDFGPAAERRFWEELWHEGRVAEPIPVGPASRNRST